MSYFRVTFTTVNAIYSSLHVRSNPSFNRLYHVVSVGTEERFTLLPMFCARNACTWVCRWTT